MPEIIYTVTELVGDWGEQDFQILGAFSNRYEASAYCQECQKADRKRQLEVDLVELDRMVGWVARPSWRVRANLKTGKVAMLHRNPKLRVDAPIVGANISDRGSSLVITSYVSMAHAIQTAKESIVAKNKSAPKKETKKPKPAKKPPMKGPKIARAGY